MWGALGVVLAPCVFAARQPRLPLVQVTKMIINERKNIEIIGTASAAAENNHPWPEKAAMGEAARDFHRAGGDGA